MVVRESTSEDLLDDLLRKLFEVTESLDESDSPERALATLHAAASKKKSKASQHGAESGEQNTIGAPFVLGTVSIRSDATQVLIGAIRRTKAERLRSLLIVARPHTRADCFVDITNGYHRSIEPQNASHPEAYGPSASFRSRSSPQRRRHRWRAV